MIQRGEITLNTLHVPRRHVSPLLNQDHPPSSSSYFYQRAGTCQEPCSVNQQPACFTGSSSHSSCGTRQFLRQAMKWKHLFISLSFLIRSAHANPYYAWPACVYLIPLLLGINSMMTQSGLAGNNAYASERNRWGPGAVCCLCKCAHVSRSTGARQFHCDLDRSHIAQDGCWACQVKRASHSEFFLNLSIYFNLLWIHVRLYISGHKLLITGPEGDFFWII